MPHTPSEPSPLVPSRREVVAAAAWAVPAIVMVATTPAVAVSGTSGGTVPVAKLRPSSDFAAQDRHQYDPATNTTRGPLAVYVRARYDQNIVWWPNRDPGVATVPYTLVIDGPLGTDSLTGVLSIAIGGYTQEERIYPVDGTHPIPVGTYRFMLVLWGSDGSTSSTTSVVVS